LLRRDRFSAGLGIEFVEAGPGRAVLAMTVAPAHLNCYAKAHGGALFALADTAFGMASNSHDVIAVGIDAHMAFAVAVEAGERLTARAREITRGRRTAVYRVDVERRDGTAVAAFTGTVYITGRPKPDGA
jgi:acyl-CoA thioesterase